MAINKNNDRLFVISNQQKILLELWVAIIGLHALHQIEESMGFFRWVYVHIDELPKWVTFNLKAFTLGMEKPVYFLIASLGQLFLTSFIAYYFRKRLRITRLLMLSYLIVLAIVFIWHIAGSIAVQSPAPVMVTCLGGLYLIPFLVARVLRIKI
jgi:hypothetical protein